MIYTTIMTVTSIDRDGGDYDRHSHHETVFLETDNLDDLYTEMAKRKSEYDSHRKPSRYPMSLAGLQGLAGFEFETSFSDILVVAEKLEVDLVHLALRAPMGIQAFDELQLQSSAIWIDHSVELAAKAEEERRIEEQRQAKQAKKAEEKAMAEYLRLRAIYGESK